MPNQDGPAVHEAISEAVADSNLKVVGDAPAEAIGSLYQALSHSTGLAFENAGNSQQQHFMTGQSMAVQGVSLLYTLPTAEQAVAASNIQLSSLPQFITAILGVVQAFNGAQSIQGTVDEPVEVDNSLVVNINQRQQP